MDHPTPEDATPDQTAQDQTAPDQPTDDPELAAFEERLETPRLKRGTAAAAPALAAAMLAVGEVIEPDKTEAVGEMQSSDPVDPDLALDFGALPPLD